MNTINNPMRFAELEYCLQSYFDGKLVPMMKQVQDTLANKKVDEKGRYQSSLAGIFASVNPYADNTDYVLKHTGKWLRIFQEDKEIEVRTLANNLAAGIIEELDEKVDL